MHQRRIVRRAILVWFLLKDIMDSRKEGANFDLDGITYLPRLKLQNTCHTISKGPLGTPLGQAQTQLTGLKTLIRC